MNLEAIKYQDGRLDILDQLLLPWETKYVEIKDTTDGWTAIRDMQVRGAPAIAIVGCLSLSCELKKTTFETKSEVESFVTEKLQYLMSARPTAVNMSLAAKQIKSLAHTLVNMEEVSVEDMRKELCSSMEAMLEKDLSDNRAIGEYGADHILRNAKTGVTILTHCNTGSLATAGYGTALGVIRSVHAKNRLTHVYCTETRPYNQGSRLTAYELVHDSIPATLICDSVVSALIKVKGVNAVVVGADRVAANGDTANKIGTYQLAIAAKHHGIPFYIAAPTTSIDTTISCGDLIPIEERPGNEITSIMNNEIAAPGISCWNPAFDVTPACLITGGIITEKGVFAPDELLNNISQ